MATQVSTKTQAANPTKYSVSQVNPALAGGTVASKKNTPVVPSVTQQPTSMPVSSESAARGVVGYGAGGAAQYGSQGALQAGTTTNTNGSQSFSGTTGQRNMSYATTLSNTNKIDQVPKDINALQSLAQKGQVSDGETIYNADGSQVRNNNLQTQTGASVQQDAENDYFNSGSYKMYQMALENLDANTASLIANAQKQSEQLRKDTNEVSRVQSKSLNNALLMGGATGQGSSARYAPVSSEGILAAQEGYRVKQIMAIDQKEQAAIAAAQEAQRTGKFELLSQQVQQIEKLREEKVKAATELNKTLATQANKLREQEDIAMKDNAIAELYTSGTTSVSDIMKQLRENGVNMSSKQVKEALDNLVPEGLQDMIDNARDNGADPAKLAQAMQSGDINKAYQILGNDAAKAGTGIVAEYNFYKRDALANGKVPVDFNTYQNMDANRKKSIAKAGVAGSGGSSAGSGSGAGGKYSSDLDALVGTVRSSLLTGPAREGFDAAIKSARNDTDKLSIIASTAKIPNTVRADIANTGTGQRSVKKAIKLIEDGVETGVLKAGQQYAANVVGRSVDPKLTQLQSYLVAAIQPYRNAVTGAAWGTQEEAEYQKLFGSAKDTPENLLNKLKTLDQIMTDKRVGLVASSVSPLADSSVFDTGATLINNEDEAEKAVIEYGIQNKGIRDTVRQMEADGVPFITIKQVLGIQ